MEDFFDIAFNEVATPPRVLSTRSPPSRLESLPATASNERSPSLRGSKHSKIPDIANQPLNTLLPSTKDDIPHSQPFYLTSTCVLNIGDDRPPWDAVTKQAERRLLDFFDSNSKFQSKFLSELLSDCLYEQINGICSGYIIAANAGVKKDRRLLAWLQEEVIEPTVFDEAELSIYEELWDNARMITDNEIKPLAKVYEDSSVDESFIHFLKDHHRKPLTLDEGKSIYSHRWGEVLYHLNKIISRASLMENYAIRRLQEQFLMQIASQVLFEEGVKYMEQEMEEIDQRERIENPPREIRM